MKESIAVRENSTMRLEGALTLLIVAVLLGCSNPVEPTPTQEPLIEKYTLPTFSESEAIGQVWNHIRSEPPIEYVRKVQDYQAPTECDTYQGDDWVDKCIVAPLDAWFAAGEPYVDYLWREDVECFAWDRRYQFGTSGTMQRFTLSELSGWEAYFYNEADIVEEAETFADISEFPSGLIPGIRQFLEVRSQPHWVVSETSVEEGKCFWIVREQEGVVWAN